ncbi:MAG: CPBP family intramembrane metalloprotease, partial [Calditrichaeota bacterium]|nr:CPBP family intramembrane metalloprotease [Calditrichota bacterium]
MTEKDQNRTKRNLIIFVALVIGLAALAGVIDSLTVPPDAEPGAPGPGQALWIISPFAVMLLLRLFGGDGWADLGLRANFKGHGFWWLVSILIFPVTITVTLLLGDVLNILNLDMNRFGGVTTVLSTFLISSLVKNIFEEFAWRGYLAPKVYSLNKNIWLS